MSEGARSKGRAWAESKAKRIDRPRARGPSSALPISLVLSGGVAGRRPSAWFLVVAAVATLASARLFYGSVLAQTGGEWALPLDDVYIHFDYARAAARGHPFEWSEGNGYSSGNTSVTYPFVLALGYWMGARGELLVPFAGVVAAVSVLAFLWGAARAFGRLPRATSLLLPVTVFSTGALAWSLWSGMEVAWFLGIWGLAYVAADDAARARAPERAATWLGALGALMCLTRPEGATSLLVLGVYAALSVNRAVGVGAAISVLWRAGTPAALALLAQSFANRALTGEWSANGAIVKLALENPYMTPAEKLADWQFNLRYCFDRLAWHHFGEQRPWGMVPYLLAIVPLVDRRTRAPAAVLCSSAVLWALVVALNGQVRWQNERYLMPAVAWLLASAALGLGVLFAPRGPGSLGARAARFVVIAQLGFYLCDHEKTWPDELARVTLLMAALVATAPRRTYTAAWGIASAATALWLCGRYWQGERAQVRDQIWFFGRASRNIRDQHLKVGHLLRELDPPVRRVLVGDAGAILYAADVPGFDLIGLGGYRDLPLARAGVHGLPATLELLERVPPRDRPDTMAIFPTWWPALPGWFGQTVASVPVPGNVISGGAEKLVLRADWHLLDTGASPVGLVDQERVVDEVDVCDLVSERAHGYRFPQPQGGFTEMRVLPDPRDADADLWDAGRRIPNGREERFVVGVKGAQPRLALRTVLDRDGALDVSVGGALHRIVLSRRDGWVELSVPLDGAAGATAITIVPRAGEWVSYHAWVISR